MNKRVAWDPAFGVGHETIDAQHRAILDRCNALAEHCRDDGGDDASRQAFQQAYSALMALAREHFAAEAALLAERGYPELEDYRHECAEFDYLAAEIVTTENFDPIELQRFLALWWVGHIMGAAQRQGPFLRQSPAA